MKKYIYLLLTLFTCFTNTIVNSQHCNINGGFNVNDCIRYAFPYVYDLTGCIPKWRATHGTPDLLGTNNYNTCAWMWSRNSVGEGIATQYHFEVGIEYTISFRIVANDYNDLEVRNNSSIVLEAANDIGTSFNILFPSVGSREEIFNGSIIPYLNGWQTVTQTFIPQQDFAELWVYPLNVAEWQIGDPKVGVSIDDITITPKKIDPVFEVGELSCLEYNSYSVPLSGQSNAGLHSWHVYKGDDINNPGPEISNAGVFGTLDNNVTLTVPFDSGDSFIIKHGMWNNCETWVEFRQVVHVPCPTAIDSSFTFKEICSSNLTNRLSVYGSKNPCDTYQQYILRDAITNQVIETLDWADISPNSYLEGSFVFQTPLENGKQYKIEHGVWSEDCIEWTHQIQSFTANCSLSADCNFELEEIIPRCWDRACDNWVGEYGIASDHPCLETINHVEFYTPGNCLGTNYTLHPPNGFFVAVSPINGGGSYIVEADIYLNNGEVINLSKSWSPCQVGNRTDVSENINMSPNPVRAGEYIIMTIEKKDLAIGKIELFNSIGVLNVLNISETNKNQMTFKIPDHLTSGLYFIRMIAKNGETMTQSLIVE
ncbi:T9SS type A sorting domain-containing protein [Aquimarina sp. Aq78]|uniref:T9SS type A sorting domain-containing protein n=1 Tax=Aquimarina sp. Aq78 TaxID=1191889 RepID=UPI000D0F4F23|nr:T9SS type A sorting domain-containing protein [Aquimarina sp. Aq78]